MKFAYLILVHNSFNLLKALIKQLDDEDNGIFIHLDKKIGDIDLSQFSNFICHSNVYFIQNRIDVEWGRVSLVEATLNLLEDAVSGGYDYYHLLSGVDFPIKSNTYINDFFEKNRGKEFVGIANFSEETIKYRVSRYHLINGNMVRKCRFWSYVNYILIIFQKILHIYNIRDISKIKGGPEWFSITDKLARKLVECKKYIIKKYKYTSCPDELFLQTYVWNSEFVTCLNKHEDENLACLRKIDWQKGNPYTWNENDFEELMSAQHLFARKFCEKDMKLILQIMEHL